MRQADEIDYDVCGAVGKNLTQGLTVHAEHRCLPYSN
jgi:hypothetical protein